MPRLVVDPKGRYNWEANFNPVLRMSNNAIAAVTFKMGVEKARYEGTIKTLAGHEKAELRGAQRQMEQLKEELLQLRAFAKVAQLTSFKQFDPVLRRRGELEQALEDEEGEGLSGGQTDHQDDRAGDLNEFGYKSMGLLSKRCHDDKDDGTQEERWAENERRRLSMSGNVFVTLQDIMDGDSVLRKQSDAIMTQRRLSQASAISDLSDDNVSSGATGPGSERRRSSVERRRSRGGSLVGLAQLFAGLAKREREIPTVDESQENVEEEEGEGQAKEDVKLIDSNSAERLTPPGEPAVIDSNGSDQQSTDSKPRSIPSLRRSANALQSVKGSFLKSVFITSNEDRDSLSGAEESENGKDDLHYEKEGNLKKTGKALNSSKAEKQQQRTHQIFRRKQNLKKGVDAFKRIPSVLKSEEKKIQNPVLNSIVEETGSGVENNPADVSTNENSATCVPTEDTKSPQPADVASNQTTSSSPLKGLARFQNLVKTVRIQNSISHNKSANRFKNLASALVLDSRAKQGKVPQAFLLRHQPPAARDGDDVTSSSIESNKLKLRPLEMPEGVLQHHKQKWSELMASVNSAVQWKVRALREDTGTLSTKQVIRQQVQRGPRERLEVFPGHCRTSWAMKKFVRDEVQGIVTSQRPENRRRSRNQKLIARASLPEFIDRGRSTSSILRNFREYKEKKGGEDGISH